jgi:Right handed beta helix region
VSEYRVYGRTAGSEAMYWTVHGTSFVDTGAAGASGAVPTSAGTVWSVKNLFELKNARNVVIERNIFENHWKESQPGYAIVLTPRNSGGTCTWCVVEQVRFENNVVRHVAAGINLLGYDTGAAPSQQTNGVVIRNNLFFDVSTAYGGGNGWFLLVGDGPRDVVIDHNTVSHSGSSFVFLYGGSAADPREMYNVRITNNAARHGSYGVNGDHFGYGNGVISGFLPGGTVKGNYLAGGSASRYPAGNRFAGSFDAEFVSVAGGDFHLRSDSALRGAATDGGDIGADIGAVLGYTLTVEAGVSKVWPLLPPLNFRVLR